MSSSISAVNNGITPSGSWSDTLIPDSSVEEILTDAYEKRTSAEIGRDRAVARRKKITSGPCGECLISGGALTPLFQKMFSCSSKIVPFNHYMRISNCFEQLGSYSKLPKVILQTIGGYLNKNEDELLSSSVAGYLFGTEVELQPSSLLEARTIFRHMTETDYSKFETKLTTFDTSVRHDKELRCLFANLFNSLFNNIHQLRENKKNSEMLLYSDRLNVILQYFLDLESYYIRSKDSYFKIIEFISDEAIQSFLLNEKDCASLLRSIVSIELPRHYRRIFGKFFIHIPMDSGVALVLEKKIGNILLGIADPSDCEFPIARDIFENVLKEIRNKHNPIQFLLDECQTPSDSLIRTTLLKWAFIRYDLDRSNPFTLSLCEDPDELEKVGTISKAHLSRAGVMFLLEEAGIITRKI